MHRYVIQLQTIEIEMCLQISWIDNKIIKKYTKIGDCISEE